MAFSLTVAQVRARTKTVTRRTGWAWVAPGTLIQPVVQSQGLKKGARVEPIGLPIRIVAVREEPLSRLVASPASYGAPECRREGFPELTPQQFVEMFAAHNRCLWTDLVTRLEFEYLDMPDLVRLGVSSAAPVDQTIPRRRRSPRVG